MTTTPTSGAKQPAKEGTLELQPVGAEGETCSSCGGPLSPDQRYCLNCGRRRAGARVPFAEILARSSSDDPSPAPRAPRDWTPLLALGGLGALAIVLIVGVLIGKSTGSDSQQAAAPQVVRVGGSGSGGATAQQASFKSDWPAGKTGYTVELGTLSKDGTTSQDVDAAKRDASKKGAPGVGALDSDDYGSLPGGKYVIFSGRYSSKGDAEKALKGLKKKFPNARVIKVSDQGSRGGGAAGGGTTHTASKSELNDLNNLNGDDYVKRSRKLPDNLALPGKAPPKDNKAPGGGSSGEEIK